MGASRLTCRPECMAIQVPPEDCVPREDLDREGTLDEPADTRGFER